jgi:DNA-binding IclR family transcriptional regulator
MTLALADANTGRLLHVLSLAGPTSAIALTEQLALPLEQVHHLLRDAAAIGVVRRDGDDRYGVQPAVVAALVQQNRMQLLGAAA